ncbi:MAG: hypothetical protein KIT10_09170 [Flavobacteriales bacterium]|nr:hypothetical protein [Flavobacteriales bacterium]
MVLAALVGCVAPTACRQAADAEQLKAVDAMTTQAEAAVLTLNELDRRRYDRADSLFRATTDLFENRFNDTLGRQSAEQLGNHYLVLRSARAMGLDHDRVSTELAEAGRRLRALRADLAKGLMDPARGATAIATERLLLKDLDDNTHRLIDNYRALQRVWEGRQALDSLLADADPVTSYGP